MTSNFLPSEQNSYLYCRKCIKNGRDKLLSGKKKAITFILCPKNETEGRGEKTPQKLPTIPHNIQYTANLSGVSILIAKMPLATLFKCLWYVIQLSIVSFR